MFYLEARCVALARAIGSQGVQNGGIDSAVINITVASGLTQYRPYVAYFNNASGYLVFTGAEL